MLTENNDVELIDFTKVYIHGNKQKTACSHVNITAKENSITGLLGPNGAGKSTILKALCGFHYPTEGEVKIFGSSENTFHREVTGFVPEFPMLDPSLTVMETLCFEADLRNKNKKDSQKYIREAIKFCKLEDVLYQKTGTLSKGYLQRTSFAKALCFDSKVLVLDEFSGGLDPAQIAEMRKTIKKLAAGRTIILSTHHLEDAIALCDSLYIIDGGKIKAQGSVDEVIQHSGKKNLEEAFIYFTGESGK